MVCYFCHHEVAVKPEEMHLRLAITAGEPAGVGPDLLIQLAQQASPAERVVIGDRHLLQQRAALLELPLTLNEYDPAQPPAPQAAGELSVYHVPLTVNSQPGKLNKANANYVLTTIRLAVQACMHHEFAAMVTCPVHKGVINASGHSFYGHTEFLAELTNTPEVVMLLVAKQMRVALVTTHLPLAEVPRAITREKLRQVIWILHHELKKRFAIPQPHIYVAGLNPHAGEGGYLGREEIDIIAPTLNELRHAGIALEGPLPADTLFLPQYSAKADAFLAMYHDQGLPVLKYAGFHEAVNVTLGLPIIRTSVDHGTALTLAGTRNGDVGSLQAAVALALQLAQNSRH